MIETSEIIRYLLMHTITGYGTCIHVFQVYIRTLDQVTHPAYDSEFCTIIIMITDGVRTNCVVW